MDVTRSWPVLGRVRAGQLPDGEGACGGRMTGYEGDGACACAARPGEALGSDSMLR